MRLKPRKQLQILTISDREIEAFRIIDDYVQFQAFFNLDALAAIENGVTICNFRVLSSRSTIKSKQRLGALDSSIALNAPTTRKISSQSKQSSVIFRGTVDVTRNIPNDGIRRILSGEGVRNRNFIRLADSGEDDSVDSFNVEPSLDNQVIKDTSLLQPIRLDLIHLDSKDPASEINVASFQEPIQSSIRGLRTTDNLSSLNLKQQKLRKGLKTETGTDQRLKLENDVEKTLELSCIFKLRKSNLGSFTIEIDAVSKESASGVERLLQTISFDVDTRKAFEEFIIPTLPPILNVTEVGSSKFIRIKQQDSNGQSIRVYRRLIETVEQDSAPFSLIADIPASRGQEAQFVDRPERAGKCIYRVVPFNELSMTSGEFNSSVTRASKQFNKISHPDTATILATEDADGIRIRVFNVPNDVISIRILRRSLSLNEREFATPTTIQGNVLQQLDRSSTFSEFRDRPSRANSVHEYAVELIDVHGNSRKSLRSSITQFVGDRRTKGSYRLVSSNENVSLDPNAKITFQVDTPNDEANLDIIYEILSTSGLDTQYLDEIKQSRELLGKIVGLEMLRFDTTTGLNESFGLVKAGVFEDSDSSRSSKAVTTPVQGRAYIYQFRLLLRASSTLFSSAVVANTDLETGRPYSTKMKKFNSPKVFNKGTLSSSASQLNVLSKTGLKISSEASSEGEMFQGSTSLVGETQVIVPSRDTSVGNLRVESTSRGNVIRWEVLQGSQLIDHIIIFAEYNGTLAPIKAIHFTDQPNMMYLDDRIAAPLDSIRYYVQPVFLNFNEGPIVGPAVV